MNRAEKIQHNLDVLKRLEKCHTDVISITNANNPFASLIGNNSTDILESTSGAPAYLAEPFTIVISLDLFNYQFCINVFYSKFINSTSSFYQTKIKVLWCTNNKSGIITKCLRKNNCWYST